MGGTSEYSTCMYRLHIHLVIFGSFWFVLVRKKYIYIYIHTYACMCSYMRDAHVQHLVCHILNLIYLDEIRHIFYVVSSIAWCMVHSEFSDALHLVAAVKLWVEKYPVKPSPQGLVGTADGRRSPSVTVEHQNPTNHLIVILMMSLCYKPHNYY